jgi:hypothetical protein
VVRHWPIAVVIVLVGAAGYVQGVWTGRWSKSDVLAKAVARMSNIPLTAGDWVGQELPTNPRELAIAGAEGCVSRKYTNRRTGAVVTMMLLCGPAGPLSVHTPDVCYSGSGFVEAADPIRHTLDGDADAQFLARRFRKEAVTPIHLRVLYGWSAANAKWDAPENPRLTYAGQPVLYKLYLNRELAQPNEAMESDPILNLLRALRPQLRAAILPEAKASS